MRLLATLKSFALKHEIPIILLCILILLRIPNLFEPYWYGDEAIYLTIGNGLRSGLKLYKEIIDHKTPLVYVIAMLPSQFWFKFALMAWSSFFLVLFWNITKIFTQSTKIRALAALAFLLLTTLPPFEGHVANGELFVLGFTLAGAFLLFKTETYSAFLQNKTVKQQTKKELGLFFFSGVCFSLGILTKVPALFDIAGVGSFMVFLFAGSRTIPTLKKLVKPALFLGLGLLVPLVGSVLYFASIDALPSYLEFALLYNFRYSAAVSLPFTNTILLAIFSLPGKSLFVVSVFAVLMLLRKKISPAVQITGFWFVAAMFSVLLSSRPYPHYLVQVLPPLVLLIMVAVERKNRIDRGVAAACVGVLLAVIFLLRVGLYSTHNYYNTFFLYAAKRISSEEYRGRFNSLVPDTYAAVEIINRTTTPNDRIFIWGTNPMLYALSRRNPAGRYTVSFHIKDFRAYDETMRDIEKTQPPWIVVMKEERGEFPAFYTYLFENYVPSYTFETLTLYRRLAH